MIKDTKIAELLKPMVLGMRKKLAELEYFKKTVNMMGCK
jgi:hypothetical protein